MMQVPLPQQRGSSVIGNSWCCFAIFGGYSRSLHKRPHGGETAVHDDHLTGEARCALTSMTEQPSHHIGHLVDRLHAAHWQAAMASAALSGGVVLAAMLTAAGTSARRLASRLTAATRQPWARR